MGLMPEPATTPILSFKKAMIALASSVPDSHSIPAYKSSRDTTISTFSGCFMGLGTGSIYFTGPDTGIQVRFLPDGHIQTSDSPAHGMVSGPFIATTCAFMVSGKLSHNDSYANTEYYMELLIFAAGFVIISIASRQIGQTLKQTGLPLISVFLFTGIVTGPYLLNLITDEAIQKLRFVDEISLGLIAFAAGSELYLKELRHRMKSIAWITSGLVVFTFFLTSLTFFMLAEFIPFMKKMSVDARVAVSVLAGAILVARSPSSAIAIVKELRAKGPFTQTALGVTVIMDVVVITLFAANSAIAGAIFTGLRFNFMFLLLLVFELGFSVFIGFLVCKSILCILILPVRQPLKTCLILATGFLVFVFSAQIRGFTHHYFSFEILLEPLLICMMAGFLVANTSRFRKDFSKILSDIGPPVYVAFFTLTGASMSLDILARTWPIALTLFFARGVAIFAGAFTGGILAKNPLKDSCISWMAYITQAGVGLGLAKEVIVEFPEWGTSFATIIISVIALNQIVGPPLFKQAIKIMGEDHPKADISGFEGGGEALVFGSDGQALALSRSLMSQGWQVKLAALQSTGQTDDPRDVQMVHLPDLSRVSLRNIGADRAGAIVAMLSDDDNFRICETGYEHFGTQTLIARLNSRENFARFQALGVLIVDPSTAIVNLLDHFVRSPSSASLFMGMHREQKIVDLVLKNPALSGIALRDIRLPFDTIIMSIRRRGVLIIPHGYTWLEAGDLVTLIGSITSLKEVALRFDVNAEHAMLDMIEKAAPRELTDHPVKTEVRAIINSGTASSGDRFDHLLKKSLVMDLKQAMDKDEFFNIAAHGLCETLDMRPSDINQMLRDREAEVSTVLSPGLAVPHIIIEGEGKFSILLARCKQGILFDRSKPLVYAAFVLVGTKDERRFHLTALSAIAQIVMDPRFERKWMRAKDEAALKQVLLTATRKREV